MTPTIPPATRLSHRPLRDVLFFGLAIGVFFLDQLTKSVIREHLLPGQSIPEEGWFRITHVTNTGAAFGLFTNQSVFLLATTLVGLTAIVAYYVYPPVNTPFLTVSLGLQLGGAIGNLVDRLRLGHVTDFLDFRIWPVFNVADSAIVVGVCVLGFFLLWGDRFVTQPAPPPGPEPGTP